jgi:beta-1,4-N-acetylglucosaminyltransferase
MEKVCFITTGATAEFRELIEAVLTPECMKIFKQESFTILNFQCGETFKDFEKMKLERLQPVDIEGLKINAFDFKQGLTDDMRECQARAGIRLQGLVILHAGMDYIQDPFAGRS